MLTIINLQENLWPQSSHTPSDGGLVLKVCSVDSLLPVAMCDIHSLLVQLKGKEGE